MTMCDYYSTLADITTIIVMLFGLYAGYYYFTTRRIFDEQMKVRDYRWMILEQMNVTIRKIANENEKVFINTDRREYVNRIRGEHERSYEWLTDTIVQSGGKLPFSDQELTDLVRLQSKEVGIYENILEIAGNAVNRGDINALIADYVIQLRIVNRMLADKYVP